MTQEEKTKEEKDYSATCLCGAIRFELSPPTRFCAHCHCHYCRQAHGAGFVTWVGVPEDQLHMRQGEELPAWYASSKQSRRGFCSRCGTTLFYRSELSPGEVHIVRACIEGEIDRAPQLHAFSDQQVDWITIGDDLPRFETKHEALAKYRQVEPKPEPK